jgi:hypothetical protein
MGRQYVLPVHFKTIRVISSRLKVTANSLQRSLLPGGDLDRQSQVSLPGDSCVSSSFNFMAYFLILQTAPAKWNCPDPFDSNGVRTSVCTYHSNMGWRYVMYTSGALVFVMSVARITIIRLKETPKYLLGEGKDTQLVQDFHAMAAKYNRPCSITVEMLDACGVVQSAHGKTKFSISELTVHFRGLFVTRTTGLSTILIWLSWTLIVGTSDQVSILDSNFTICRVLHIPSSTSSSTLTSQAAARTSTSQPTTPGATMPS